MDTKIYTVIIDRPLGSAHPDFPTHIYPVNYGYVDGIAGGDGEPQDAYVIGIDTPVDEFTGRLIAIIHRRDDVEDKWVIAPENMPFNKQQIEELVYFQEQYYDSYIDMIDDEMWDAYDESERLLGFQVPRSMAKALPDGVYHIVVTIYTVMADKKILVTQRSKNKTYAMLWEVTGGSILAGETAIQGAARELREETGITKNENDIKEIYRYVDKTKHVIYHTYITSLKEATKIHLQFGETIDYRFVTYAELKELIKSERFVPSERGRFNMYETLMDKAIAEAMQINI